MQALCEAVRSWCRADHPNVLRFLGVFLDLGLSPALISQLCVSGPVMKYLKVNPKHPMERLRMQIIGVAEGLEYLQGIIHGDLCTKKVLIEADLPVIGGYGMFNILGPSATSTSLFSSPTRFAGPEYFSDETETSSVRTKAGDVYAFAMVTLEILSQLEPYHHLPTEHAVFKHLLQGGRPIRTDLDHRIVTDRIWSVLTSLWNERPLSRPAMHDVVTLATMYASC
ncbi:kinase-like domain-containing protein [Mycena olivaceomarginata]|nr:kinase-like domain-containing protein [Mycena olivaceomarginata]